MKSPDGETWAGGKGESEIREQQVRRRNERNGLVRCRQVCAREAKTEKPEYIRKRGQHESEENSHRPALHLGTPPPAARPAPPCTGSSGSLLSVWGPSPEGAPQEPDFSLEITKGETVPHNKRNTPRMHHYGRPTPCAGTLGIKGEMRQVPSACVVRAHAVIDRQAWSN